MTEKDPITASIQYLESVGYSADEAANLIGALIDSSPERLWELAPKWIDHVADAKRYMTLLECIGLGIMEVTANDAGEWMFALRQEYVDSPQGRQFAAEHGLPTRVMNREEDDEEQAD